MDPAECAPVTIAGSEAGYRDTGYRAVYSVTMNQPGPAGAQSVTQTVIAYPDSATARRALIKTITIIRGFLAHRMPGSEKEGAFSFTEPDGGATGDWAASVSANGLVPAGGDYYTFDNQRFRPDTGNPQLFYVNQRAVGMRGNALVDVSVRGVGIYLQDMDILGQIFKNIAIA